MRYKAEPGTEVGIAGKSYVFDESGHLESNDPDVIAALEGVVAIGVIEPAPKSRKE